MIFMFKGLKLLYKALGHMFRALEHKFKGSEHKFPRGENKNVSREKYFFATLSFFRRRLYNSGCC